MQVLAHNLAAQFTNRQLNITTNQKAKSSEKLSSGYRINRSADDAAGLSISEKMRKQIRGLNQASENVQDGISLCQVADGALGETTEILQRMRKLSVQAANGTNSESDRSAIQQEMDQLTKEVDRIADTTSFNEDIYPLNSGRIPQNDTLSERIKFDCNGDKWILPDELYEYTPSIHVKKDKMIVDGVTYLPGSTCKLPMIAVNTRSSSNSKSVWGPIFGITSSDALDKSINIGLPNKYKSMSFKDLYVNEDGHVYYMDGKDKRFLVVNYSNNGVGKYLETDKLKAGDEYITAYKFDKIAQQANVEKDNLRQCNIWIQAGADTGDGLTLSMVNATTKGLGIKDPDISVMSEANCDDAMNRLGDAIEKVSSYRSLFGAQQNRLECAKAIDDNTAENTTAAESRIRDTDMAKEMVGFSKNNILAQVGQSMLAQANQSTQGILSLLQ